MNAAVEAARSEPGMNGVQRQDEGVGSQNYVIAGSAITKELDIYHLIFAPTYACNLRCRHCYLPDHEPELLEETGALRMLDEWREIVLAERGRWGGIFHVKGGEPFAVRYLGALIDRMVVDRALVLMLTTNGTIHGTKRCSLQKLERCNVELDGHVIVNVSLDGATEQTHSLLRGWGTFEKTVGFVREMRNREITTHLNCVVHRDNVDDIPEFVDLALREGVSQVNFLPFVPRGYGAEIWDAVIDPFEIYWRIAKVYQDGGEDARRILAGSYSDILRREGLGSETSNECVGGYRGLFYVVPNGDVFSCPNLVDPGLCIGNLDQQPLQTLHEQARAQVYEKTVGCGGCSQRYLCKGARYLDGPQDKLNRRERRYREFQQFLNGVVAGEPPRDLLTGTSYCFSRNL